MNNIWLGIFVPKIKIKVAHLGEIRALRREKIKIYRIKKMEEGYEVTIRRRPIEAAEVVGKESIYIKMIQFVLPVAFIWAMLLVAVEFITLDYEIRGNLAHEDFVRVEALVDEYFFDVGRLSFFRGNESALHETVAAAFHDYIWVDVTTTGSRLIINIYDTQVTERVPESNPVETLYATATGLIHKVKATGCRVLVEPGQVVYVGQALITCYTPTGFGTDLAPILGSATGVVYADVWYEVAITFPRTYGVRMATGSSHSHLYLHLGNLSLRIWGQMQEYTSFDVRNEPFNPLSFLNISPITLERVHYYEKSDIILTNEVERIRVGADKLVERELAQFISGSFEIVDLDFLNLVEKDDMVTLTYHATLRHDIAN